MAPPHAYKPIQPAPFKRDKVGASSGSNSGAGSSDRQTRRLKAVTQACQTCRRYKARCDGARPRCGGCVAKGKSCGYEGEEGQSRQAAMKSRLEALEKLVSALQAKPPDEAEQLLQRIRTADDIISLASSDGDESRSIVASNNGSGGPSLSGSAGSAAASTDSSCGVSNTTISRILDGESSENISGVTAVPLATSPQRLRVDASAYLIRLIIPSAQSTKAAIQSFFSSSGKLFHVFSPRQVEQSYKSVFSLDGLPNTTQKVAICCLCCVAAIGIQYNAADFDKGSEEIFYDVARHFFVDVVEDRPLDAIKVCTLLAMYNIMNKATVALAFVEIGLSMSRRHSLHMEYYRSPDLSAEEWVDYRRTWRTLLFFSSWLTSTLGYISGNDAAAFQKLVPLVELEIDHSSEVGDIVQTEMTKISLLKSEILRMHLAFKELTTLAMDSIMKDLQDWYGKLPAQMHLANLGRQDLPDQVRRSIFHVHLLYLGAIMLLYRRIASQFVKQYQADEQRDLLNKPREKMLLNHAQQGVIAAKHSARILGLLLAERGIFKRCWLVIFQAHTSCVVILHSVAQKQLHNLSPSDWADDLKQAQLCLDTLEFCGTIDPVALRFHVRLSGIFLTLAAFVPGGPNAMRRTEEWVSLPPDFPPLSPGEGIPSEFNPNYEFTANGEQVPPPLTQDEPPPGYLLTIPPDADPQKVNLSFSLLLALCRPWGDPDTKNPSEYNIRDGWRQDPTRFEHTHLIQQLEWDFEGTLPFRWDTGGLEQKFPDTGVSAVSPNRFLGSEEPSGWASVSTVEVMDDYDGR
ncbi:hypothetical protein QBC46DRAFT_111363 [Diplogelasinospora grovesii]|uniref:Zn(2)-C6 fungal-type domain-containing protein n=1 Tax=Diplogelasinospora grovesii TaxID=303347 RepID=A0AAN6N9R4_9PEZI|nr:hypothetical protein QBC46DRAFT_111363 [Diplogelasinospora grovesii]